MQAVVRSFQWLLVPVLCLAVSCSAPGGIATSSDGGTSGSDGGSQTSQDGGSSSSNGMHTTDNGQPCTHNSDCQSDICFPLSTGLSVCTEACNVGTDCVPGWRCQAFPGLANNICQCTPSAELCDGKDNDCNGRIDDGPGPANECVSQMGPQSTCQAGHCTSCAAMCNGACTDTNMDPNNCGRCGYACPAGSTCEAGMCQCSFGGQICGGSCVDTTTDPYNCGRCSNVCSSGRCTAGQCQEISPPDGGMRLDAGMARDAGTPVDAGVTSDAGIGPVGDPSLICQTCFFGTECGPATNFCLTDSNGGMECGTACNTDSDCPSGDKCWNITDTSTGMVLGKNCFPLSGVCPGSPPPPDGGTVDAGPPPPPPDAGMVTPGNPAYICRSCTVDTDCRGPNNYCLQDNNGINGCGTACNTDADCPSGDQCFPLYDNTGVTPIGVSNCFPSSGVCPTSSAVDGGASVDAGSGTCTADTWTSYAAHVFATSCNGCHTYTSVAAVQSQQATVVSDITNGTMPPTGSPPLDAATKSRILKWLSCGGPQ